MIPVKETPQFAEYVNRGVTYRILKTNPPTLIATMNYGHPDFANRPQTWTELMVRMLAQEIVW